jgi:hypothetical protein
LGLIDKIGILKDQIQFYKLIWMKSWVKLQEKSKFRIKGRIEEPQNQEPKSKKHISLRTEINQNMGQFERN